MLFTAALTSLKEWRKSNTRISKTTYAKHSQSKVNLGLRCCYKNANKIGRLSSLPQVYLLQVKNNQIHCASARLVALSKLPIAWLSLLRFFTCKQPSASFHNQETPDFQRRLGGRRLDYKFDHISPRFLINKSGSLAIRYLKLGDKSLTLFRPD